ncbi:MAG: prolyl oligopeptidase family serine peptidase [Gammaproteobacteria bacterium]
MKTTGLLILAVALVPLAACSAKHARGAKTTSQPAATAPATTRSSAVTSPSASTRTLAYPAASTDGTVDVYFGTKVPAPYQWMEDLNSPKLHKWVAAENQLTNAYLAKIPVRSWIKQHLTHLWNYAKEETPIQLKNGMLFFRRNSGLQNQSVVYVQKSATAKPRVLIDPNKLSPDGSIQLKYGVPSPDGKYYAYALSTGGSDWETVHVMNVATGKQLPDTVKWVKFSGLSWTLNNDGFYYSRYPKPPTNEEAQIKQKVVDQKLYYHKLGTPQSDDKLIYSVPKHPEWIVGGSVSESGRYLFVFLTNGTAAKNELYYADLGNPSQPNTGAKLKPLYTKNDAQYTPIGVVGHTLYLQTNLDAPRGQIVATTFTNPSPKRWRTVVPQAGKGDVLRGATMAHGDILANYLDVAKSQLKLFSTHGKLLHSFALPTLGTVGRMSARNDSRDVYYAFTSYLYPTTLYRYDVADGKTSVYFKPDVKFDPSPYETKQVFYTSKDGTKVPMFIVSKKGLKLDGSHPTILYGYGGFDISITPRFSPMLPIWLELGGVYAVPNIRGGGAYGEAWHHAGMLGNKQNVFDDFAWAEKYLIQQGYTSSKHLGIQGYSNGGLLTGASITEHPHLFGAAYIGHGVLDMLRYQDFSGGALWAPEYGTSSIKQDFEWLIKYSPLQNVHKGTCYPPTFITTSWNDDRVVPMHELKFTAKIQQAQGCSNPILLHVTGGTSHTYMPTDKQIAQSTDVWAFEAYNLGIKQAPASANSQPAATAASGH